MLPLSHDEVVHGKGSLSRKMPGDDWQKLANLRLLYGYQFAQPGKKSSSWATSSRQWREWTTTGLDWDLLEIQPTTASADGCADLNSLHRSWPALHERDYRPGRFRLDTAERGRHEPARFLPGRRRRRGRAGRVQLHSGAPAKRPRGGAGGGYWRELLNSDAVEYGGGGIGKPRRVEAQPVPAALDAATRSP